MTWLAANWPQVVQLAWVHLAVCVPAIAISVLIAVPIGRLAHRVGWVGKPLLGLAALMYAIPSLPLLVVIPVVFGFPLISPATMVVALTVYGVALLVRTAADAFGAVDTGVHDAALAVGHSRRGVFWRVDLPLATPVLVSGLRVVTVSTVGLVTIGAVIGQSSLGSLLTDGFQRGIVAEVVTGVVATIVLAIVLDMAVLALGRLLTPWTSRRIRGAAS